MNRAARIASKAPGGVVLCSDDAWAGYTADPRRETIAVLGCSKGKVMLKGIGHVGIVTCQRECTERVNIMLTPKP